jgi:CubicO group peptidase (beta-lactamase class C family)
MPPRFRAVAAGLALALLLGRCAPTVRVGLPGDRLARMAAVLEEQQKKEHIPGLAFVAVLGDRVIVRQSLGQRDLERKLPVTADTLFPIGSCTKAFTAMAVAASQDAGLLSLDDSPHRFLPYFKMADPDADARVTLRDMLSHQTGLKAYADLAAEPGVLTREQYLRVALSARPVAPLRSRFQYSNAMYTAAGEVLAAVHRQPWEAVIERTLLRPLGMSRSVASVMSAPAGADQAVGYEYRPARGDWQAVRPPVSLAVLAPAGSIGSTANDMARWLRFLTAGGTIDGRRVVSEASLRELTRPHVAINDTLSYGLGWAIYRWNGHTVVEHNGGSRGISALMSFIPARHAGFAFLANTSPNFMTRIGNAGRLIWPVLLGEEATSQGPVSTAPAAPSPSPAATPPAGLPSAAEVVARIVAGLGGDESLGRHRSMEIRAMKSYANQGVTADLVVLAEAPDRRAEEETWTAAGTRIGAVRVFFDGDHGGQETTFGQDEMYTGEENERARRDAAFRPWLDLPKDDKDVRLERTDFVDGEEAYVLERGAAGEAHAAWHISTRTGRVLQVEATGKTTTFADYRDVDGELVPFRTTSVEELGEVAVEVSRVRFNVDVPAGAFAPRRPAAPP